MNKLNLANLIMASLNFKRNTIKRWNEVQSKKLLVYLVASDPIIFSLGKFLSDFCFLSISAAKTDLKNSIKSESWLACIFHFLMFFFCRKNSVKVNNETNILLRVVHIVMLWCMSQGHYDSSHDTLHINGNIYLFPMHLSLIYSR